MGLEKVCLARRNFYKLMETLTHFIDEGNNIDIIYLDFRKAFDQIPHKRLLSKLSCYGFTGMVLNWISHFVSDRTEKVRIGDKYFERSKSTEWYSAGEYIRTYIIYYIY